MASFEEVDASLQWLNKMIAEYAPILGGQFKEEDRLRMITGILETAEAVREAEAAAFLKSLDTPEPGA